MEGKDWMNQKSALGEKMLVGILPNLNQVSFNCMRCLCKEEEEF